MTTNWVNPFTKQVCIDDFMTVYSDFFYFEKKKKQQGVGDNSAVFKVFSKSNVVGIGRERIVTCPELIV